MSGEQSRTIDNRQYQTEIKLALNKVKSKLPFSRGYRADKHFEYLSHNSKSISMATLNKLLLFKQEYKHFNPSDYLGAVLHRLNDGLRQNTNVNNNVNNNINGQQNGKQQQLSYRGYMRLIMTERIIAYRPSQVNMTLLDRISLQYEMNHKFDSSYLLNNANAQADNIVGMLLFLECLKQSELRPHAHAQQDQYPQTHRNTHAIYNAKQPNQYQCSNTYNTYDRYDRVHKNRDINIKSDRYYYLDQQIKKGNKQPLKVGTDANSNPYYYYGNSIPSKPVKSIITFGNQLTNIQNGNNDHIVNYKYEDNKYGKSQHMMRTMDTKYTPYLQQNPEEYQQNGRSKSAYPFLARFSSKANIWKNIAERNWDYKTQFMKRSTANTNSTAFIYEDGCIGNNYSTMMPKSPRQAPRPVNRIDKSGYYTK